MLVDSAKITIEAGNGGDGSVSFHREKYVAAGGPDGGDGGNGGNVIFVADKTLATLMDFRYRKKYKAENGISGSGGRCDGKNGADIVIKVPCGTIIRNIKTDRIIADLTNDGDSFIAAKGGKGGWGNVHFATPTRQVPKFAKPGLKGEAKEIQLELKLIADVGLIGFPNVGKSTLLSMVSAARPKIANYHFTTLEPNLGVVSLFPESSFVIADIPGLIEGASEGVGLGHDFLRHIERTRMLIHVVDVSGIEGRNPIEDFDKINEELEKYSAVLAKKIQVIAANKTDIGMHPELAEQFRDEMEKRGFRVFEISAATSKGVRELINYTYSQLREIPVEDCCVVEEDLPDEYLQEPFTIHVEDGVYCVEGGYITYLIESTNFEDYESVNHFQDALRRKGVIEALEHEGIKEGDTVRLYDIEFDFVY
ncbi:MAG: GTPase ObgE [Bacillota bacterium]|nr:GTPase ObgE [Bacillota bacterium]